MYSTQVQWIYVHFFAEKCAAIRVHLLEKSMFVLFSSIDKITLYILWPDSSEIFLGIFSFWLKWSAKQLCFSITIITFQKTTEFGLSTQSLKWTDILVMQQSILLYIATALKIFIWFRWIVRATYFISFNIHIFMIN